MFFDFNAMLINGQKPGVEIFYMVSLYYLLNGTIRDLFKKASPQ
jgi:hypothetical protein